MPYTYTAYGLRIASDMELFELAAADDQEIPPDVTIRRGQVAAGGIQGGQQISPFIWTGVDEFWLEVPKVARFYVAGGRDIIIDPAPGIDQDSVRVFLLGSGFGALLFQRRRLVLHGNAVEFDGKGTICVGPSGVGKSTLTAAFVQRGYRVLADDVVPIDDHGMAIPGYPRIKLWKDVADKLGIETDGLKRIRPALEKFNLPLYDRFCDVPRKVSKIYLLSDHHGENVNVTPVSGLTKFSLLRENTYRHRFMAGMALQPIHLQQCSALAGDVAMAHVQRPKTGFKINDLVDALVADMQEVG